MNTLQQRYSTSLGLLTDLYKLTTAYGYWKSGKYREEAVFYCFLKDLPFGGDYAIVCGLQDLVEHFNNLGFSTDDVHFLATLIGTDGKAIFNESFLNYLQRLEFECDVDAIPEGTLVFDQMPLLRIKGPIIQVQLLESIVLNIMNFQTLIASKATRIKAAAGTDKVMDISSSFLPSFEAALAASRAAYIGGFSYTANLQAGKIHGIPLSDMMSVRWIKGFSTDEAAFEAYAAAMPNHCILYVDSMDSVNNAIRIGVKLREKGFEMKGICLEGTEIANLSREARKLLDNTALQKTMIIAGAGDNPDEYQIAEEKEGGARVDLWAVSFNSTKLFEHSALGVYPVLKTDFDDSLNDNLLCPIFKGGKQIYTKPLLSEIKLHCQDQIENFRKSKIR
jgi:nicotinate phosphoribosyltransferase